MTDLLALTADLPLRHVAAGEVLIDEGADGGTLYVLASGTCAIERDGVVFASVGHPGAVFGEMAVVLGKPATATVRAQTDVDVRVVDDGEAFLTERPGAALAILRMTATRLDGLTQYLVDVKQQFVGLDGHLGMVGQILDTLVNHQAPATRSGSSRDPEGDHIH